MPYTAVATKSVGDVLPASHLNGIRSNQEYFASTFPHCSIYESTAQSVANNTNVALTSDEERSDIGGMHSTSSNTSRITIPASEGGLYLMTATVTFAANATGQRLIAFWKNGVLLLDVLLVDAAAAGNTILPAALPAVLAAGDYVECYVRQSSGGALNVTLNDFSVSWRATS